MCVEGVWFLSLPVNSRKQCFAIEGVRQKKFGVGWGYWLRFLIEGTTEISGLPIDSLTIPLMNEWNLISSISTTISLLNIDDPDGLIISGTLYGFNDGYVQVETLEPGKGYWIRSSGEGEIIISNGR